MSTPILPDDYFHTYIYVHFSWACCELCKAEPNLEWAWEGVTAKGEAGVQEFTIKAVERLKAEGWVMRGDELLCPQCAARIGASAG
jgi:hypothetical protein